MDIQTLAMATGLAWGSGLRVYAVLFLTGLLGYTDIVHLPAALQILSNPWVMTASGFMFVVEFFADKVPALDSVWDGIHTFIRIPAGAVLAGATFANQDPVITTIAAILGGMLAAGTHFGKAGTRAMINTSPEPASNIMASLAGDAVSGIGLIAAFKFPVLFLCAMAVFVGVLLWLLPKLFRTARRVIRARRKPTTPLAESD